MARVVAVEVTSSITSAMLDVKEDVARPDVISSARQEREEKEEWGRRMQVLIQGGRESRELRRGEERARRGVGRKRDRPSLETSLVREEEARREEWAVARVDSRRLGLTTIKLEGYV